MAEIFPITDMPAENSSLDKAEEGATPEGAKKDSKEYKDSRGGQ